MEFYTYILISQSTQRLYIGQSQDIQYRLEQHNLGKSKSTKNRGPWVSLFSVKFSSRKEAVQLEMKLKKWKSRVRVLQWIEKQNQL